MRASADRRAEGGVSRATVRDGREGDSGGSVAGRGMGGLALEGSVHLCCGALTCAEEGAMAADPVQLHVEARALPLDEVQVPNVDFVLAEAHARAGAMAVLAHRAEVERELPAVDWTAIEAVSDLASELGSAARAARVPPPRPKDLPGLIEEAYALRRVLVTSLEAAKQAYGLEKTRFWLSAGRGAIAAARDLQSGAAWLAAHPDICARLPLRPEQLARADALAAELVPRLRPRGARRRPERNDAIEIRNRLWTLLVRRYREVRRVAYWIWGDEFDAYAPPLGSRFGARRRRKAKPEEPAGD